MCPLPAAETEALADHLREPEGRGHKNNCLSSNLGLPHFNILYIWTESSEYTNTLYAL